MKKKLLLIVPLLITSLAYGQWQPANPAGGNVYLTSGNVGIGNSSPTYKLHITTPSTNGDGILINNTNNSGYLTLQAMGSSGYSVPGWANSTLLEAVPASTGGLILGSYTGNIGFQTGYRSTRMTISQNGNVGIGTFTPQAALDIGGGIQISAQSLATPPPDLSYGLFPYGGIGLGIYSGASLPSQGIGIWTAPGGVKTEVMRIASDGRVGIGTLDPGSYKLAVKGNIHVQAVQVDMNGWSDYVFKPSYRLLSLRAVKSYIDQNHHLPDVPSEKQVKQEGIDLGEMNSKLLKKIEELTLYLIEKDKKDQDLQNQINYLKKQILAKSKLK